MKLAASSAPRIREVIFGVLFAIAAGAALTWWLTSGREPLPKLEASTSHSTQPVVRNGARAAETDAERRLVTTFVAARQLKADNGSYAAVTLPLLGNKLGDIGFLPGERSSGTDREVSVQVAGGEQIQFAARDGAGCAWLRERGLGPEIVRILQVAVDCSANAAPLTGWVPVVTP